MFKCSYFTKTIYYKLPKLLKKSSGNYICSYYSF